MSNDRNCHENGLSQTSTLKPSFFLFKERRLDKFKWVFKMPQLTTEMRVLVVKKYLQTESYVEVRETFGRQFPNRNPPCKKKTVQDKIPEIPKWKH